MHAVAPNIKTLITSDAGHDLAIAHDVNEACELVEAGFMYVTGEYSDGGKVFRKRK